MQRTKLAQAVTTMAIGAVLMTAASASFAQSAVLKITGTITPSACTPSFSGGDAIDFGEVTPGGEYTRKTTLQISCTAPTFVAFKVSDNRDGTQVNSDGWGTNSVANFFFPNQVQGGGILGWNDQTFGLGKTSQGQKIGAYTMQLGRATVSGNKSFFGTGAGALVTTTGVSFADQVPVIGGGIDAVYKHLSGFASFTGWNGSHGLWMTRAGNLGGGELFFGGDTGLYIAKGFKYTAVNAMAVANLGDLIPSVGGGVANAVDGTNFTFPIGVRAKIANGIATGDSEKLDGQATFALVYI